MKSPLSAGEGWVKYTITAPRDSTELMELIKQFNLTARDKYLYSRPPCAELACRTYTWMRLVFVAVVVVAMMALQTVAAGMRRRSPRLARLAAAEVNSSSLAFAAGVSKSTTAWGWAVRRKIHGGRLC